MTSDASRVAHCAYHPATAALCLCSRCGDHTCAQCLVTPVEGHELCARCDQVVGVGRYHVPPVWRFVLFSVLTLGLYQVYWSYQCWRRIKRADNAQLWPLARAIFANITLFHLVTDVNGQRAMRGQEHREVSMLYPLAHLLLGVAYRLPGPLMWIFMSSVFCVLPVLRAMRDLSGKRVRAEADKWRARHTLLALIGIPALFLAIVGSCLPDQPEDPLSLVYVQP